MSWFDRRAETSPLDAADGEARARGRAIAVATFAAALTACTPQRPGLEPRHVFLVTVEHLRADHCSFLMHDRPATWMPSDELMRVEKRAFSFDDFASDGVVFSRCYAPSPIPRVSLATVMTGRSPLEHGVVRDGDRVPGEVVTLAEAFRAAGFRTGGFVGGPRELDASFGAGFEDFATCPNDGEAMLAAAQHVGRDPGSDAPTFTWVHLTGLAPPWPVDEPVPEILGGRELSIPGYEGPFDGGAEVIRAINAGELAPTRADRDAAGAAYDRAVASLVAEAWIGLHDAFDYHSGSAEASETMARTVFVVAGVGGVELLERGAIGAEGLLSEGSLHVPLVLRHPDSLTGQRIFDHVVALEDVAPTLLEWMRLPPLPDAHGRSLLAVTDSYVERDFPPRPAFAQLPERAVFSARDERWRLVWNPTRAAPAGRPASAGPLPELELLDVESDPDGRTDVSADHPDVAARMTAAIRAWRESLVLPADAPRTRR